MGRATCSFSTAVSLCTALLALSACEPPTAHPVNFSPEVQITTPDPGQQVTEGVEIVVTGFVEDADQQDSLDIWWTDETDERFCEQTDVAQPANVSCPWTPTASNQRICLNADDGQGEDSHSEVCVNVVAVSAEKPTVNIHQPEVGGVYYSNRLIEFAGTVSDQNDAPHELSIEWESGIDGVLSIDTEPDSSGNVRASGNLSEGEHYLTLTATNTSDESNYDSVIVMVGPPNSAPECAITHPEDGAGVLVGAEVCFEAQVSDPDVPSDWLEVTWTSDADGELGTSEPETDGFVSFCASDLSPGTHRITIRVEDEVGESCTTGISLNVGRGPSCSITAPAPDSLFYTNESVSFEGTAEAEDMSPTEIAITWSSSLDGVLNEDAPGWDGALGFVASGLSEGAHTITLFCSDGTLGSTDTVALTIEDCYRTWYRDADGDGYGDDTDYVDTCDSPSGYSLTGGDCDDTNAAVYPGATEICDELDNDCDGSVDDGVIYSNYYPDNDGDGEGDGSATPVYDCIAPGGYVANFDDCDDTDATINSAATETCDGVDEDCDGVVDNGFTYVTYYADADGDGYGDSSDTTSWCAPLSGYATVGGDCDETDASINPGATESCDGVDEDCDGTVDDGVTYAYYYPDSDRDGYGASTGGTYTCLAPTGYATSSSDCDDGDASIHPGATETCDGVDEDCDGTVDDGLTFATYYPDSDRDGYGASSGGTYECAAPSGYVTSSSDCDDGDSSIHPGATEICDGLDQDCDGSADDGLSFRTYYRDYDGDGYGNSSDTVYWCDTTSGYITSSGDCDDFDSAVYPGAREVCNGDDDDCDGSVDEGLSFYYSYDDGDGDGYGDPYDSDYDCTTPSGNVSNSSDCDDTDRSVYPGASEDYCDGVDQDCDGSDAEDCFEEDCQDTSSCAPRISSVTCDSYERTGASDTVTCTITGTNLVSTDRVWIEDFEFDDADASLSGSTEIEIEGYFGCWATLNKKEVIYRHPASPDSSSSSCRDDNDSACGELDDPVELGPVWLRGLTNATSPSDTETFTASGYPGDYDGFSFYTCNMVGSTFAVYIAQVHTNTAVCSTEGDSCYATGTIDSGASSGWKNCAISRDGASSGTDGHDTVTNCFTVR